MCDDGVLHTTISSVSFGTQEQREREILVRISWFERAICMHEIYMEEFRLERKKREKSCDVIFVAIPEKIRPPTRR
jgi:hypothetical protein